MRKSDITKKSFSQRRFKIAIVSPGNSPMIREARMGFVSGLASQFEGDASINVYGEHASTDQELKEIVAGVAQEKYDLIQVIGVQCARIVKEVMETTGRKTPAVFVGVRNPEKYGLVQPDGSSWDYMTGTKSVYDHTRQIALLHWLKPEMKRVLVAYNPSQLAGTTQEASERIIQLLAERQIRADALHVYSRNDINRELPEWLSVVDTVITLRDHTTMTYLKEIAQYCNHHHVTLCGSDPSAVEYGAAIGIGSSNYHTGYVSALPARLILEGHSPQDIPVNEAPAYSNIELNQAVMQMQNLNVNPEVFFALKNFKFV